MHLVLALLLFIVVWGIPVALILRVSGPEGRASIVAWLGRNTRRAAVITILVLALLTLLLSLLAKALALLKP